MCFVKSSQAGGVFLQDLFSRHIRHSCSTTLPIASEQPPQKHGVWQAVITVAAEGPGCLIPNVPCTTGVDAARAILKNASTEAPAVATKSVTKTGITTVDILTPAFAASSLQQKL
ncbi:unnamed protein product [Sphagnum troendelagicum]